MGFMVFAPDYKKATYAGSGNQELVSLNVLDASESLWIDNTGIGKEPIKFDTIKSLI